MRALRFPRSLLRFTSSQTCESKRIIYVRGTNFKVVPLNARSEDIVELDGEISGKLPLELELLPHKVNVISGKK